ncbi:tegument protein VP22 [Psittacid alphaherpesvirus 5]|uniref:Tegument protein VP22 n=1 Tax=Psittacid alphaherpesvirus 5 TaxID=2972693 RepID=A0A5P9JS71_9ALPH|nr:tegument protein VP22 [Psittacid alphaherpesvirus 5]QFU14556.1 tegument protein VP22 [Psittacid alphaherpesvirus 5]UOO01027.1 tegument protein VP22 [Psittacid alphaherpesvirus 5]
MSQRTRCAVYTLGRKNPRDSDKEKFDSIEHYKHAYRDTSTDTHSVYSLTFSDSDYSDQQSDPDCEELCLGHRLKPKKSDVRSRSHKTATKTPKSIPHSDLQSTPLRLLPHITKLSPSKTPPSNDTRWRTNTVSFNRNAFIQAIAIIAFAQAEIAATQYWKKRAPRTNKELEEMIADLTLKLFISPGPDIWTVSNTIACAMHDGQPITEEMLEVTHEHASEPPRRARQSSRTAYGYE